MKNQNRQTRRTRKIELSGGSFVMFVVRIIHVTT